MMRDTVTDQSMRTLAAEMIREKLLLQTYEEVPYSVAVEIDEFVEEGKLARISATVLVERESHKAIVIGKHGERLKAVGTDARRDMEQIFRDESVSAVVGESAGSVARRRARPHRIRLLAGSVMQPTEHMTESNPVDPTPSSRG